jgi:hypothetical protein
MERSAGTDASLSFIAAVAAKTMIPAHSGTPPSSIRAGDQATL